MIKKILWLCLSLMMYILSHANIAEARTNFDNLHMDHEIVAKYEHGHKGYQAISKDSYGGYSYGKEQISTWRKNGKSSTFDFFIKYTKDNNYKIYEKLIRAGGYQAAYKGKKSFINTWEQLANQKSFQKTYDKFLLDTQIIPVYVRLDKNKNNHNIQRITGWASEDNAIQAAIKSIIIQHGQGGAYKMLLKIAMYNPHLTKAKFLESLYGHRMKSFPQYKKRYVSEYRDLKNYLTSGKSIIM